MRPQRLVNSTTSAARSTIVSSKPSTHAGARHHDPGQCERAKAHYQKKRAAGLCAYGTCEAQPEGKHVYCSRHLLRLRTQAKAARNYRVFRGLCVKCGKRPQFWSRWCILCRLTIAQEPLPYGAKRALRTYRAGQAKQLQEQIERATRLAALRLLETQTVTGKRAEALRLYVGDGTRKKRRSYAEVARIMGITRERVRQLLLPSQKILASELSGRTEWIEDGQRQVPRHQDAADSEESLVCAACNNIELIPSHRQSYLYRYCSLQTAVLRGLGFGRCSTCHRESILIPNTVGLKKRLAKFIILKPNALTGSELRFLRCCLGFSHLVCSTHLGVTCTTIRNWENSQFLTYPNDLATRVTVSALLGIETHPALSHLLVVIKRRTLIEREITLRWIGGQERWLIVAPGSDEMHATEPPLTKRVSQPHRVGGLGAISEVDSK